MYVATTSCSGYGTGDESRLPKVLLHAEQLSCAESDITTPMELEKQQTTRPQERNGKMLVTPENM